MTFSLFFFLFFFFCWGVGVCEFFQNLKGNCLLLQEKILSCKGGKGDSSENCRLDPQNLGTEIPKVNKKAMIRN